MSEIEAEAEAVSMPLPPGRWVQWMLIRSIRWGTHVAALIGVFLVGISWPAVIALAICVITGMLGVTLAYHRYFAHRSFNTSRWFQFFLALWGATSLQRGPIWWAAVHRHHHRHPDTEDDWHTPLHGFWHAHNGWLESPHILDVSYDRVPDLTRYPEMRFIDTFYHIPALLMIATLAAIGSYLQAHYPALGTSAWQMVVWGFFVRTVIVWHLTFTTNSVLHLWGSRRFDTNDNSRNSYVLGVINLGDGFHNNHHRYAMSARHGFYWWEFDITYYLIKFLEALRLVRDVKTPPADVLEEGRAQHG
ncbi:MAG: acyl-CoA desaturase [Gammaproteobacteria bacterium]|nr:acyl-CoA desaturase [Gammaproteobacteria bacterium]